MGVVMVELVPFARDLIRVLLIVVGEACLTTASTVILSLSVIMEYRTTIPDMTKHIANSIKFDFRLLIQFCISTIFFSSILKVVPTFGSDFSTYILPL